jgi:Xaa-Pro aminopeptidase
MLTREGCLARRNKVWDLVPADVEWLLVADPRHLQYLANFAVQMLSFSGGERGWLLLERGGAATLLGDNFGIRAAASTPFIDREIVEKWYDHKHSVINRDHCLLNALKQLLPELRGRKGMVEAEALPVGAMTVLEGLTVEQSVAQDVPRDATTHDLGSAIRQARRRKEPDEIALLKSCMRAGEAGQARMREVARAGVSELEVFLEVQKAAVAAAGKACYIYGDFRATTKLIPKAGGLPTDYRLQNGDIYILDYSVVLDGYRGDFTNSQSIGEPSAEIREMFALCEAGMRGGEATLKAGAKARDVFAAVDKPYVDAGRTELFAHHAGHGIGLAHPEPPILVPESDDVLLAGDVVTLEPGAYQAGIGGMRIEHNYLITETGYERLSNHKISLT